MHADKNFYVVVNYFSTHVTLITAVFRSVSRVSATLLIRGVKVRSWRNQGQIVLKIPPIHQQNIWHE